MLLEKGAINMNNERIALTMKEQRTNDIMVKLISKKFDRKTNHR